MKAKAKFAYMLSMGGSLLSKDGIGRKLQLPRAKCVPGKSTSVVNKIEGTPGQEPVQSKATTLKAGVSRMERRHLPSLTLMVERVVCESHGEQKPRQI
ncbi:MAG: hypothetical protein EXS18_02585 [Verrucomicrobiae bacterium]|nr:hypothetical protein [Verrucomicrobiae bacterium]